MRKRRLMTAAAVAAVLVAVAARAVPGGKAPPAERPEPSTMGALFMGRAPLPPWLHSLTDPALNPPAPPAAPSLAVPKGPTTGLVNVTPGVPRFQSETAIAAAGQAVVVGFNDANGFSSPAGISVSGFSTSSDGGQTFTYGHQLPVAGGGDAVRGDPDVKVWTNPSTQEVTFVYSSLYATPTGASSICVHVSTDGGMTWMGPRVVTPATSTTLFADKSFIDLDPETGRLIVSWTSFGTTVQMRTTYSDDFGLTWAPAVTYAARTVDGQGSCPRFDPTSDDAYIVWRTYGSPSTIALVRSPDNGQTWTAPQDIVSPVVTPLPPYGSDRINGFPSLAVSPVDGSLHLVYASKATADFGDVLYSRSTNHGSSWSVPVFLNADPGNDRCQFFPWVSIDASTGRLDAMWYSQRAGAAGSDLTGTVGAHSLDGGVNWTAPVAVTFAPFHAEYGQDTGQPNIGDYNQCASLDGRTLIAFGGTGVADWRTAAPDAYVGVNQGAQAAAALHLDGVAFADAGCVSDGFLVAGEIADLTVTLRSDAAEPQSGITGELSTTTSGVTVLSTGPVAFADLAALGTATNTGLLRIELDGSYPCGQTIDFRLQGSASSGDWILDFSLPTGAEDGTVTLLSEDFDAVGGGLPAGWTWSQLRGVSNPWAVSTAYAASGAYSLFCPDLADTNLSRVTTPTMAVPADAKEVEISFRLTYEIEDVGDGRQAYDGALMLIVVDGIRILAPSFSTLFEGQYPMQVVRASGGTANPLTDLSCWSGNVLPAFGDVRIRYPGLAGHTVQFAFEMGSDINTGGTGIFIDDVLVRSIPATCGTCTATPLLAVTPAEVSFPTVAGNQTTCLPVTVDNLGDGFLHISGVTGCESGAFSLDLSGLSTEVLPFESTGFLVCVTPTAQGPDTCHVEIQSDGGNQTIAVTYDVVTGVAGRAGPPRTLIVAPPAPNPFNPRVDIRFGVPRDGPVSAAVYDLAGRRVRTLLAAAPLPAGYHSVSWDGTDARGRAAASGVYVFRVEAEGRIRTVTATLVR